MQIDPNVSFLLRFAISGAFIAGILCWILEGLYPLDELRYKWVAWLTPVILISMLLVSGVTVVSIFALVWIF